MELMDTSPAKNYEVDVLIGKLAAIFIIARASYRVVWRVVVEREPLFSFGAASMLLRVWLVEHIRYMMRYLVIL